jgi:hypothetical protein
MKGKFLFLIALILILSGGRLAMAHEGDKQKVPSTSGLHGSEHSGQGMEGMDMSGDSHDMEGMDMNGDGHDMEGMDMSGDSHDMDGMDMSGDGHDMEGMDMSGDGHDMEGMDMSGDGHDMEGMDMGGSGHSHGPVVETPPNIKVLGIFGAVNLAFILVGIWNKWFRRRGEI